LHIKASEENWVGPTLTFQGIRERGCNGAGEDRQWLIFGSETHGGITGGMDAQLCAPAYELFYGFLDAYLKDAAFALPKDRVLLHVEGTDTWQAYPDWPLSGGTDERLYLRNVSGAHGGSLASAPADTPISSYEFTPPTDDPCANGYDRKLVYTSDPRPQDTPIIGVPSVTLSIRVNVTDTDLFVYLLAYDAGFTNETLVSQGSLRLRFRGPEGQLAGPVTPGTITEVRVDMVPVAHLLRAGQTLGLYIASADCGYNMNHNTGAPAATDEMYQSALVEVFANNDHPSVLTLPHGM
jgi:predicted acyl esterase